MTRGVLASLLAGHISGGGSTPGSPALPDVSPEVAALRPRGAAFATLGVGPTRTYKTVLSALQRAAVLQQARGDGTRIDVVIDAGTYPENSLAWAAGINLFSATGVKGDVVIAGGGSSPGIVHPYGDTYLEGLTLTATDGGPKYPVHMGATGRTVLVDCVLTATDHTGDGSGAALGMDGADGSYTLLYHCDLTSPAGSPWSGNLHSNGQAAAPLTLVFDGCSSTHVLDYSDLGTGQPDDLWFVNGTGPGFQITSGAHVVVHTTGTPPGPYDD